MTDDIFAIKRTTTDTGDSLYSEGPMQTHTANYYFWKGHRHATDGQTRQDHIVPDSYQYPYNKGFDNGREHLRKVENYDH